MTLTGRVKEKRDGVLTIGIVGANSLGNHVTGAVTLELPRGGSA
jgi:hypothetical protein